MAVEAHFGTTRWNRQDSRPGIRVLYTSNFANGQAILEGSFWNDHDAGASIDTTPTRFPLLDISGSPTTIGLRTNAAFDNQIGGIGDPPISGYPGTCFQRAYYTSTNCEFELYGIPKDLTVDLVLGGQNGQAGSRGGLYILPDDGRRAEVVIGETLVTGAVIFSGVTPVDGTIRISFVSVTDFIYVNIVDLLAYKR